MFRYQFKRIEEKTSTHKNPVQLYRWLLQNMQTKGNDIRYTRRQYNAIKACDMEGFALDICEIDEGVL